MKTCALVLGGYVNGYSIVQELHEQGVADIVLLDYARKHASFSKKITSFHLIDKNRDSLRNQLLRLRSSYDYIVVFPTDDLQVEMLCQLYDEVAPFCFLPVHKENSLKYQDKYEQYQACDRLGIPYPKTVRITSLDGLRYVKDLEPPIIIKPVTRKDIVSKVFRSLIVEDHNELQRHESEIEGFLEQGLTFLASEIVPGDGSNIYAYVGYRNRDGEILNEWTGKKLSQYPDDFGVFASASNEAPEEILEHGRCLLHGIDIHGIAEPEFKYDHRDGTYKLMEINLRSMMWHRVGNLSGVHMAYTQWADSLGMSVEKELQNKEDKIHFVYLKHELMNLISRKRYYNIFINNMLGGDKTFLALFDRKDMKPFLKDARQTFRSMTAQCLRILKQRFLEAGLS